MKKQLLTVLALSMACVLLVSCGQSSGGSGGAGGDTDAAASDSNTAEPDSSAAASDSSAAEDSADEDGSEASSKGGLLQEFEFTKTVSNEELEKPITVCGLKYDESEDRPFEDSLDQERDSFHLHISILSLGYDMDTYLTSCRSEQTEYATSIAQGYNIQQADAANGDGSAKLIMIRYTNFEDGGENDYQCMGDLVYTDGTSVAATDLLYSVDREYGNGEEVEAEMRAIAGYYGIDHDTLDWADVESRSE